MTVGDRIRLVRLEQDVTQQELADYIGVSKQAVYKYENNIVTNIPTDKVDAIARKLNVSPAFLMGWEEQQKEKTEKAVPTNVAPYQPQNVAPLLERFVQDYRCLRKKISRAIFQFVRPMEHDISGSMSRATA